MPTLRELGEWGLIAALKARFADVPSNWMGIGDDTAVGTLTPGWQTLTTVDLLVEGIHFQRHTTSAEDLGWKALAVNVSDIASMGGLPRWAVVGLSAPSELEVDWVLGFYDGLAAMAHETGTRLVGGDTTGSTGPITLSVTVVGEAERPIRRVGARPGDVVFVTGPVGASAAGLWAIENPERVTEPSLVRGYVNATTNAHRRPVPQVAAGRAVHEAGVRVAMLDDSDGVARSVVLLAEANRVDVRLEVADLPIDAATRAVAGLAGVDPVDWALFGGEDYHLIGAVAPDDFDTLTKALALARTPCHAIGQVLPGTGRVWMRHPDQQLHELAGIAGFEHFGKPPET
jgi:thiamine-monophosphate kinase